MGGLFSKPKINIPSPAAVPPPEPEPEVQTEPLDEDLARKRAKLSRPKAKITGDLTPDTGKKRFLG